MADKEPKENQKTPNVNFINFQRQLRGIIKDIKEHKKKVGLKKLFGSKHENMHVNGSILLKDAPDNKEIVKYVKQLEKEPSNVESRLMLVNAVLAASKDHPLSAHLNLMLQAAIPIYLGDINPTILQIVVHTYRSYLERLGNIHKQNMMAIKSTVLKNVNMSGIDVSDEDTEDTHVRDGESIKTEIQIAESLIENC